MLSFALSSPESYISLSRCCSQWVKPSLHKNISMEVIYLRWSGFYQSRKYIAICMLKISKNGNEFYYPYCECSMIQPTTSGSPTLTWFGTEITYWLRKLVPQTSKCLNRLLVGPVFLRSKIGNFVHWLSIKSMVPLVGLNLALDLVTSCWDCKTAR